MRTIWKETIRVVDEPQAVAMPPDAVVRHVDSAMPGEFHINVWFECDPRNRPKETRFLRVHGTGHDIAEDEIYLGTAMMPPFVWHVFEVPHPQKGEGTQ
jgi:hypothetical protein